MGFFFTSLIVFQIFLWMIDTPATNFEMSRLSDWNQSVLFSIITNPLVLETNVWKYFLLYSKDEHFQGMGYNY